MSKVKSRSLFPYVSPLQNSPHINRVMPLWCPVSSFSLVSSVVVTLFTRSQPTLTPWRLPLSSTDFSRHDVLSLRLSVRDLYKDFNNERSGESLRRVASSTTVYSIFDYGFIFTFSNSEESLFLLFLQVSLSFSPQPETFRSKIFEFTGRVSKETHSHTRWRQRVGGREDVKHQVELILKTTR